MTLTAADVMPLVLRAMPSFQATWDREVREWWADPDEPGGRSNYMDAGAVASHAVALLATEATGEVAALMDVVERLHVEGDEYVQTLATIGYLEDMHGDLLKHATVSADDLLPLLGDTSRKWWDALERFWTGQSPSVSLE